jgi:hypothetical protein
MSWRNELHLLPTRNRDLVAALIGQQIVRLIHHADCSPAELLADPAYSARGVTASQLFSLADGPVLLQAHTTAACIGYSSELLSVTVQVPDDEMLSADWPVEIEAIDPTFSEPRFARMIGRTIIGAQVLQRTVDPDRLVETTETGMRVMAAKILDRPREGLLVLDLDGGGSLLFGADVLDAPNDFAVMTGEDLSGPPSRHRELMRVA